MRPRILAYVSSEGELLAACFEKDADSTYEYNVAFKDYDYKKIIIRQVPQHIANWLIGVYADSPFSDGYAAWEYVQKCGFRRFEL